MKKLQNKKESIITGVLAALLTFGAIAGIVHFGNKYEQEVAEIEKANKAPAIVLNVKKDDQVIVEDDTIYSISFTIIPA